MNITRFTIGCVFIFSSWRCVAQVIYFDKTFDVSNKLETGWSVLITPDSNYVTLSNGSDLFSGDGAYNLSFFSPAGNVFNNKSYETTFSFSYVGLSNTLLTLPDNNGYIFGGSNVDNATGDADNILVKFDSYGDTIFVKEYATNAFEALYGDALTQDDHILLVGFKGPYSDPKDVLLMKTDTNGNLIWQKQYGGAETDWGYSIFENHLFEYVIGAVKIYNSINANPWIIITDSSGNIINEKEFLEPFYSCAIFLAPTLDNKYLMSTCVDTVINPGDYDRPACIIKLDTNFNVIWKAILNNHANNGLYISKQLADSSIVFIGTREGGNPNAAEGWIGKLDKNGNKLWEHQYRHDNSLANYFSDFEQTSDGGFIITGSTYGASDQDLWLVKLDSMGCLEPCATNIATFETGDEIISLQCYPNPARLQTSVWYNISKGASEASFTINDLSGKLLSVFSIDRFANSTDLNLSSWSPGVYLCSLMIDGVIEKTVKLLVQ